MVKVNDGMAICLSIFLVFEERVVCYYEAYVVLGISLWL
jgi:hypothetical protein